MFPTKDKPRAVTSRLEDFDFSGVLKKIHQDESKHREKRYMQYEKDPFTKYQNFMYRRALYGLNVYEDKDIRTMHWEKKRRIIKVHKKAQNVLNLWKQEITISWSNQLLEKFYANIPSIKKIIEEYNQTDPELDNNLSLKDLGITKVQLVTKFIQTGVLPKDFYELKEDPHEDQKLPRLKAKSPVVEV